MGVSITINNVWARISGLKDVELIDKLDKETSYYVEGYRFTKAYKSGFWDRKTQQFRYWDGKKHLLSNRLIFPIGLLARIEAFLKTYRIQYVIEDQRKDISAETSLPTHYYTPRPYQIEALETAIKYGRGMIRMGTGAGKSLTAVLIAAHYNLPTMIYVVGKDLLYQFHQELQKVLNTDIGLIGDGQVNISKINVCSIWTAATAFELKSQVSLDDSDWVPEIKTIDKEDKKKIKKAIENSNLSIFDEAHFLATDTIQSIFKASKKCKYLFGMTGTPWRDDGANLLLESICGKMIYNMPSSNLIDMGYLVQPKITFLEVPPYYTKLSKNYHSVYSKYVVNNDFRNELIELSVKKLIEKGRKPLVLVKFLNHGDNLCKRLDDLPIFFVNGAVSGEKRQEVKQDFINGNIKCLIASSVYDLGVDIPCLDALVLGGGGKSSVRALQRIGRVIRPSEGKKDALVVDFLDNAKYLDKHSAARIAVYETEHKFRLKFPKDYDTQKIKKPQKIATKIRNL